MTIEETIEMLETEYEKAKQRKWINNPLAYALYQVWKKADSQKRSDNNVNKQDS